MGWIITASNRETLNNTTYIIIVLRNVLEKHIINSKVCLHMPLLGHYRALRWGFRVHADVITFRRKRITELFLESFLWNKTFERTDSRKWLGHNSNYNSHSSLQQFGGDHIKLNITMIYFSWNATLYNWILIINNIKNIRKSSHIIFPLSAL